MKLNTLCIFLNVSVLQQQNKNRSQVLIVANNNWSNKNMKPNSK
jgi:hypothetical protein